MVVPIYENLFSVNPQPVAMITALDSGTVRCRGDPLVFAASGGDNYRGKSIQTIVPFLLDSQLVCNTFRNLFSHSAGCKRMYEYYFYSCFNLS